MKPGRSLVVLIDTENAPRVLETIQATQVLQLDVHQERHKNGVACPCGCTGGTIGIFLLNHHHTIEGATTRPATNNFAAEVVGMVAAVTLPWERDVPVSQATWTRMQAAAKPSLFPYTDHHHRGEFCSLPNGL